VPGGARGARDRTHGPGPSLRSPPLRPCAACHRDDDRDLRGRHRLQHRAVPVRPVVRQRSGAGHSAAGIARPDPRHRSHPNGSCDRPRVLISRVSGVRGAADAVQRRRGVDLVRYRLRRRHAGAQPAERRRDVRHRQLLPGAGSSAATRRRPPKRDERRRPRATPRRRDQPRAVGEALRALAGRDRPSPESERRHGHDRWRRTATIRRRADRRLADAHLAAAQYASAGAAHARDAHQLRRRPFWRCGALAVRRTRRPGATGRRGDRRTGDATDDQVDGRGHRRRPADRQQLLSTVGRGRAELGRPPGQPAAAGAGPADHVHAARSPYGSRSAPAGAASCGNS
jgi:hypothetical protein